MSFFFFLKRNSFSTSKKDILKIKRRECVNAAQVESDVIVRA